MVKDSLREFGLSEKEIKVYLALIELGQKRASAIAQRAGTNRSTTYIVLDELMKRGLVGVAEKNGVKLYNSAPPEQLVAYLKDMAKKYERFAHIAKKIAPQLKTTQKVVIAEPKVQLYEGVEGIRTVYEDTLSSLEKIRTHATKKGSKEVSLAYKKAFGDIPEILVQGNKIILVSPGEKFAAVVESNELAKKIQSLLRLT